MKKALLLTIAVSLFAARAGFSQDGAARERIETARIGFITNRLNLTSEQAPRFWPVFNEYSGKKQDIQRSLRKLRSENATLTATDAELLGDMKEMMNLKQQEVDLEKDYLNRFLRVINPRQLAELYRTEQDFRRELLRTLQERRANRRGPN